MTATVRLGVAAALLFQSLSLLVGWWAGPAAAHTDLISTTPAEGDRLAQAPTAIALTFSEEVSPALARVRLTVGGAPVGELVVRAGPDARTLVAAVPSAGAGNWLVEYRVTSVDGHGVEGSFTFSVQQASSSPTSSSTRDPESHAGTKATDAAESRGENRIAVGAAVVGLGVAVLFAVGVVQRRRGLGDR